MAVLSLFTGKLQVKLSIADVRLVMVQGCPPIVMVTSERVYPVRPGSVRERVTTFPEMLAAVTWGESVRKV